MSKISIITGLPRSRLAWLSCLLRQEPRCMALHESVNYFGADHARWLAAASSQKAEFFADCSSWHLFDPFAIGFAERVVLVTANPGSRMKAHLKSLRSHLSGDVLEGLSARWEVVRRNYAALLESDAPNMLKVPLRMLDDYETCLRLCDHVAPGFSLSPLALRDMTGKKIVQHVDKLLCQQSSIKP